MATIITTDNIPAVLSQLAERQDELADMIGALTDRVADQAVEVEQQDERMQIKAQALRASVAALSRNIADTAKAVKQNGNGDGGDTATSGNPGSNGKGNPGGNGKANPGTGIAGAGVGGEASLGPLRARAEIGGGIGTWQSRTQNKSSRPPAAKAEEPETPARRRAHRWL
jgi:TolA-binding protein